MLSLSLISAVSFGRVLWEGWREGEPKAQLVWCRAMLGNGIIRKAKNIDFLYITSVFFILSVFRSMYPICPLVFVFWKSVSFLIRRYSHIISKI